MATTGKSRNRFLFDQVLHTSALQLVGQLFNPAVSLPHIPWCTLHTAAIKVFQRHHFHHVALLQNLQCLLSGQRSSVCDIYKVMLLHLQAHLLLLYCSESKQSLSLFYGLFTCSPSEKGSPHIILYGFIKYECNPNLKAEKCSNKDYVHWVLAF